MAQLPSPRGPITEFLFAELEMGSHELAAYGRAREGDALSSDDLHLALYVCYELHYRSFEGIDGRWEWDPSLLALRRELEEPFERALCAEAGHVAVEGRSVPGMLIELSAENDGPSLSSFLAREGTREQFDEFLIHRSAYHLKEADPHSFAIPRLAGRAKAALVEIQADEYGGGSAPRMHASLFAKTMREVGLDDTYGRYLDRIPGVTLATVNLMSLFGLHRRWRGAIAGHLAIFELTSSIPNRRYGDGLRRLGFGEQATDFFDEHVVADSVHDMIAAYDLAGSLVDAEPDLAADVIFGGRCLIALERRFTEHLMGCWERGVSSLLPS
jgi:hypothetical protein